MAGFVCQICAKAYAAKETLNRHIKTHDANTRYSCSDCTSSFSRKDLLTRHSRIHRRAASTAELDEAGEQRPAASGRARAARACTICAIKRTRCERGPASDGACWRCTTSCIECTWPSKSATTGQQPSREQSLLDASSGLSDEAHHEAGPVPFSVPLPPAGPSARAPVSELLFCTTNPHTQNNVQGNSNNAATAEQPQSVLLGGADVNQDLAVLSDNRQLPHQATSDTTSDISIYQNRDSNTDTSVQLENEGIEWLASLVPEQDHAGDSEYSSVFTHQEQFNINWDWLMDESIAPDISRSTSPRLEQSSVDVDWLTKDMPSIMALLGSEQPASHTSGHSASMPHSLQAGPPPVDTSADLRPNIPSSEMLASMPFGTMPEQASLPTASHIDADMRQLCADLVVGRTMGCEHGASEQLFLDLASIIGDALHIYAPAGRKHLFDHCAHLYFEHFHSLWPLMCAQHFHSSTTSPPLYLSACTIGAMYGDEQLSLLGRSLHATLRTRLLAQSIDLNHPNQPSHPACLTLLLNQIAALYLGHKRSFYVAQQLGVCLHTAARRLRLFHEEQWPHSVPLQDSSTCSVSESYRRLALGIYRVDVYLALLLGTRPIVAPQELHIRVSLREEWPCSKQTQHPPSDRITSAQDYSDLVHMASDSSDRLPALQAVDLELVLMGLTQDVWRLNQDRFVFQRLHGLHRTLHDVVHESSREVAEMDEMSVTSTSDSVFQSSLNSVKIQWKVVIAALRNWSLSFASTIRSPAMFSDNSRIFSCRILYHLLLLQCYSDIVEVANSAQVPQHLLPAKVVTWLDSHDCVEALKQAAILHRLVFDELEKPPTQRARLNLLAFVSIHHAAVVTSLSLRPGVKVVQPVCSVRLRTRGNRQAIQQTKLMPEHRQIILESFVDLLDTCDIRWLITANFASAISAMIPLRTES